MTRQDLAVPTLDLEGLPLDGVQGYTWGIQSGTPRVPVDLTGRAARLVLQPGTAQQVEYPLTGGVGGVLVWVPPPAWRGPARYALLLAPTPGADVACILTGTLTHGVVIRRE